MVLVPGTYASAGDMPFAVVGSYLKTCQETTGHGSAKKREKITNQLLAALKTPCPDLYELVRLIFPLVRAPSRA